MKRRPQRVIEVIYAPLVGGSEMLAFNLCKEWRSHGVDARICCLYEREGPLIQAFEAAGIPYELLDIGGRGLLSRWLRALRYFLRARPTALHVHHLGSLVNTLIPAYLSGCCHIVYTEHSAYGIAHTGWMRHALPWASRLVHRFTCVSLDLARVFRELGVPAARILTIYNGVDTERYRPALARAEQCPVVRIGAVGRLVSEKDYPTLLAALALMKAAHVRFFAEIAGDGPLAGELKARAHALGLGDVLAFRGACADVPGFLRELDIYVLSSRHEGLPIAVLEAMATALPVVATRITAIPEVIEDGVTGVLVAAGDPEAMARALGALARDGVRRRRLGEAAMQAVRARYTIARAGHSYARELGVTQHQRAAS